MLRHCRRTTGFFLTTTGVRTPLTGSNRAFVTNLIDTVRSQFHKWELGRDCREEDMVKQDNGRECDKPSAVDEARMMTGMCPRSVLFVPGSKPRALHKIRSLRADCYILDLEDSVSPLAKREARDNIMSYVEQLEHEAPQIGATPLRLVLRINAPDADFSNALLDLELAGQLGSRIAGVAIPKVSKETFALIRDYVHPEHALWAFFETPQSIIQAPVICGQQVYQYAVMGYNDLAAELNVFRADPLSGTGSEASGSRNDASASNDLILSLASRLPLMHCAMQVMLNARAAKMHVLDGVFNNPTDPVAFQLDLQHCVALGFDGKTLIHPSQVGPTHEAFTPSAVEVEWARRVMDAISKSKGGVATVDGTMVEELHARRALQTLARSRMSTNVGPATSLHAESVDGKPPRRPTPSRHVRVS